MKNFKRRKKAEIIDTGEIVEVLFMVNFPSGSKVRVRKEDGTIRHLDPILLNFDVD